jgi:hypothetical protein
VTCGSTDRFPAPRPGQTAHPRAAPFAPLVDPLGLRHAGYPGAVPRIFRALQSDAPIVVQHARLDSRNRIIALFRKVAFRWTILKRSGAARGTNSASERRGHFAGEAGAECRLGPAVA